MEYTQAVSEARTLVKRSEADQWRLAQLTWEQLSAGTATAAKWAADIGVSDSYVYRLYKMWESHSLSDEVQTPRFTDAYKEVSPASAYQPRQDPQEAIRAMPPEQQAEVARDLLANPQVAQQAMADLHTRVLASDAVHFANQQVEHQVTQDRQRRVDDGQRPDFEGAQIIQRLITLLNEVVVTAGRLPQPLPGQARASLAHIARQAKPAVDWLAASDSEPGIPDDISSLGG